MKKKFLYNTLFFLLAYNMINAQPAIISTVSGNGSSGFTGDNGSANNAQLFRPNSLAIDCYGVVYISDLGNNRIRKISKSGIISTIAGNGNAGNLGDGGPAILAELNAPNGVAVDCLGIVYIADWANNTIRKVDSNGIISTIVGIGTRGYTGDGGFATFAELGGPCNLVLDQVGNLFISDQYNHCIRKVGSDGIISTIVGTGMPGFSGDGGLATSAELDNPIGIALDTLGNIYISDNKNHRVRKVNSSGIISTIAGTGTPGYSGDGSFSTLAELNHISGIAVDDIGNVYFSDFLNNRVRKVSNAGIITTLAGNGSIVFSGDGGAPDSAGVYRPLGLAIDRCNNVYVSDGTHRIRKVFTLRNTNLLSPINTDNQTVCTNAAITDIVYSIAGAGISVRGLPPGLKGSLSNNTYIISGAPQNEGVYNYTLTITDDGCTIDSVFGGITVVPFPILNKVSDTICKGETVKLKVSEGDTFFWNTNEKTDSIFVMPSINTTYSVEAHNGPCKTTDSIVIDVINSPEVTFSGDFKICKGGSTIVEAKGGSSYSWSTGDTTSKIEVKPIINSNYSVIVSNARCFDTAEVVITVDPTPVTSLGNDTLLCQGETLTLSVSPARAYFLWQDNSDDSTLSVSEKGTYWVRGNLNNCSSSDTVNIDFKNCDVFFKMPNVFTPNMDDKNDILVPVSAKGILSMNTYIYGRWGELAYETTNPLIEWSGLEATAGIYYYVIYLLDINGMEQVYYGNLSLIK